MFRYKYILTFIILLTILSSCTVSRRQIYMGGNRPLISRSAAKSTTYIHKSLARRSRFGSSTTNSKFNNSYVKNLKRERRAFGNGMTHGMRNALPSNRHNQNLGARRRFLGIFPARKNYYRGHRSKLGLFKMK